MQLEVGKKYRNRRGDEVLVFAELPECHRSYVRGFRFLGIWTGEIDIYMPGGENSSDIVGTQNDLIEEIVEPKYRPFAGMKEFAPHRHRWIKRINGGGLWRVTAYTEDRVFTSSSHTISYQTLLESYAFDDGTPCGVIEAE